MVPKGDEAMLETRFRQRGRISSMLGSARFMDAKVIGTYMYFAKYFPRTPPTK